MNPSSSSQLRDLDLVKYLENKLGNSNDLWCGRNASSLLSKEMLVELETCFQGLEPNVKLKIIQAIPHLSPKLQQLWKKPLLALLDVASRDADDWVETIADMYRDIPEKGCIRCLPSNPESHFCKTLEDLKEILRNNTADNSQIVLPPESVIVSHSALRAKYGHPEVELKQHFTLRKKPRSQQLLTDVMKAAEQQSNPANKKSNGLITNFPIRMRSTVRKPNNSLPMKGIPTVNTCKISGGFTNEPKKFPRASFAKREGGAKLIDIAELPQPLNKRRKTQMEEIKAKKAEEKALKAEEKVKKTEEKANDVEEGTPQNNNTQSSAAMETAEVAAEIHRAGPSNSERSQAPRRSTDKAPNTQTPAGQTYAHSQLRSPIGNVPTQSVLNNVRQPVASVHPQPPMPQMANVNNAHPQASTSTAPIPQQQPPIMYQQRPQQLSAVQQQAQVKAAQAAQFNELIRSANKLNRESYNMVAAFLSGNMQTALNGRAPGVFTVQLSEAIEDERLPDGNISKSLVETYFQMDFRTGEWKRLRKSRALRPEELMRLAQAPPAGYVPQHSNQVAVDYNSPVDFHSFAM